MSSYFHRIYDAQHSTRTTLARVSSGFITERSLSDFKLIPVVQFRSDKLQSTEDLSKYDVRVILQTRYENGDRDFTPLVTCDTVKYTLPKYFDPDGKKIELKDEWLCPEDPDKIKLNAVPTTL